MPECIDSNEVRNIQIEILKSFHTFCIENKLRYSLAGGTLLGAVRHQGFIPWDDDIDVMMLRPDYDYFINNYDRINSENEIYTNINKNQRYIPWVFSKLSRKNTIVHEPNSIAAVNYGINIDIFPIDSLGNNRKQAFRSFRKLLIYKRILNVKRFKVNRVKGLKKIRNIFFRIVFIFISVETLNKKMIKECIIDSNISEYVCSIGSSYLRKEFTTKELYLNYDMITFENSTYMVIENYAEYLKMIYGENFLQPPPVDQRLSHGIVAYYR